MRNAESIQARCKGADAGCRTSSCRHHFSGKRAGFCSNKKSAEKLKSAEHEAANVIAAAREKAKQIAGDAMEIKEKADLYEETATAMRNVINGYGDEWLKPTYSLLDELADEFSYTDAGKKLKEARAHTSRMVKEGIAAACDYVEENRRNTAIHFVIDAFNGKVDSTYPNQRKTTMGNSNSRSEMPIRW